MFDVEETARRVGHYKWAEMKLFEVLEYVQASKSTIFLVLELASGGELFDRIKSDCGVTEDEARVYGRVPGDIKVVDQNNDNIINANDFVILGSNRPKCPTHSASVSVSSPTIAAARSLRKRRIVCGKSAARTASP